MVSNSGNLLNEYTAPSTDSRGGQMSVQAHISCHPIWPIEQRKDRCSFKVQFISIISDASFTTQINTPASIFNTELYKHTSKHLNTSEHRKKRKLHLHYLQPAQNTNHVKSVIRWNTWKVTLAWKIIEHTGKKAASAITPPIHDLVPAIGTHKAMHTPILQKSGHTR